jgi:hypothetical protein
MVSSPAAKVWAGLQDDAPVRVEFAACTNKAIANEVPSYWAGAISRMQVLRSIYSRLPLRTDISAATLGNVQQPKLSPLRPFPADLGSADATE